MKNKIVELYRLGNFLIYADGEIYHWEYRRKLKNNKIGKRIGKWCDTFTESIEFAKERKDKWVTANLYKVKECDTTEIGYIGISGMWHGHKDIANMLGIKPYNYMDALKM